MNTLKDYLLLIILTLSCIACTGQNQLTEAEVAAGIKQTFEHNMFRLPPRVQGHYGLRLYRITGDNQYLYSALYDYYVVLDRVNTISSQLNEPDYISNKAIELTAAMSKGTRGKARRIAIKKFPEFIFYANYLLSYSARLDDFGVAIPSNIRQALKNYDFLPGLTNKVMIRAWAAQSANYVYWLRKLGIADHSKAFKQAFLTAYPDDEDHQLSSWHLKNKLYGLTHFVFAGSDYYQHHVSLAEFGWILDYFENNQKLILEVATDDIAAELGLCFMLMKQSEHPIVKMTKARLINSYLATAGMIPSVSGKFELATAEHRNVLAYMLFSWPKSLTSGPIFSQIEQVQRYLPTHHH